MKTKKRIETDEAPRAIGPYSQAVSVQNLAGVDLIFVSGQLPIDPATGQLLTGDIKLLTRQVIRNIDAILKGANSSLARVVRTDVFLKDLKNFKEMNEEYAQWFSGEASPARQTVQVADLPMGAPVEISCIAISN
ncbi:MAG: Rid family detoxifying hydrolase [Parachlamydia sp.]|nr:Rid family detoxifying hydrolase [Parachlamydia sp.]